MLVWFLGVTLTEADCGVEKASGAFVAVKKCLPRCSGEESLVGFVHWFTGKARLAEQTSSCHDDGDDKDDDSQRQTDRICLLEGSLSFPSLSLSVPIYIG